MRREAKFAILFVVLSVTLACVPIASATSFADDSGLYGHIMSKDTAGTIPLADCSIATAAPDRRESADTPRRTNTLMPECLGATNGANISSMLWMLRQADLSSGVMNGITTGINTGISTGITAVVGSLCGNSAVCLASPTPVSTVPEPGTLGLLGTSLLALGAFARRRLLPWQVALPANPLQGLKK